MTLPRRRLLLSGGILIAVPGIARATPVEVAVLIREFVGDAPLKQGLVKLDLPVMVENGNAVSMTVGVSSPPSPVRRIHVFAEGNPLPNVARFQFGPRSGAPLVSTRIRLATSQTVVAVAQLTDGSCWQDSVDLLVTLAACID